MKWLFESNRPLHSFVGTIIGASIYGLEYTSNFSPLLHYAIITFVCCLLCAICFELKDVQKSGIKSFDFLDILATIMFSIFILIITLISLL